MQSTTWSQRASGGQRTVTCRTGRFVRHEELAAVLAAGRPTAVRQVAERVAERLAPSHVAAIALVAEAHLAAPLLARLTHLDTGDWAHGTHDALATGASKKAVVSRLALAFGLREKITEDEAAQWLSLHGAEPDHAIMYAAAGLSADEAQEQERLGAFDFDTFATLASLRSAGAA